jgi:hypothetical protein
LFFGSFSAKIAQASPFLDGQLKSGGTGQMRNSYTKPVLLLLLLLVASIWVGGKQQRRRLTVCPPDKVAWRKESPYLFY